MHELYFCHFLYFSGTINNNELKRISRRSYYNHRLRRLNGWELDGELPQKDSMGRSTCTCRHKYVYLSE